MPEALRSYAIDRTTSVDTRGRFRFEDLPPGDYRIRIGEEDVGVVLRGERARPLHAERRGAMAAVTLAPGERRADLLLELAPFESIAGEIVDLDGQRIPRSGFHLGHAGTKRS
ncbi:MAG: carboxypeptidase-like regulatory domain-containing protein, partial [Longimicrobiales bacterium]